MRKLPKMISLALPAGRCSHPSWAKSVATGEQGDKQ